MGQSSTSDYSHVFTRFWVSVRGTVSASVGTRLGKWLGAVRGGTGLGSTYTARCTLRIGSLLVPELAQG